MADDSRPRLEEEDGENTKTQPPPVKMRRLNPGDSTAKETGEAGETGAGAGAGAGAGSGAPTPPPPLRAFKVSAGQAWGLWVVSSTIGTDAYLRDPARRIIGRPIVLDRGMLERRRSAGGRRMRAKKKQRPPMTEAEIAKLHPKHREAILRQQAAAAASAADDTLADDKSVDSVFAIGEGDVLMVGGIQVRLGVEKGWMRIDDESELRDWESLDEVRYNVYRHFWERGYYSTSGIKFGVDFLVYEAPPGEVHSRYTVLVKSCPPMDRPNTISAATIGAARVAHGASKEHIIAYQDPSDGSLQFVLVPDVKASQPRPTPPTSHTKPGTAAPT